MSKLFNLAKMTTATEGTGTITLGSAVSGFLTFALAGVSDGDIVSYGISDGANSEVGYGTYTASGTTLARTTILKSTNSDAAINLSGDAVVFITLLSDNIADDVALDGIPYYRKNQAWSSAAFVGARYSTDAAQSFSTGSLDIINFEDVDYDPDSLVTVGASWKFTAPTNGYYLVNAFVTMNTTTTLGAGEACYLSLYKNGAAYSNIAYQASQSATDRYITSSGSDVIYLTASQYIDVRYSQASGGTLALLGAAAWNHIEILRIGL